MDLTILPKQPEQPEQPEQSAHPNNGRKNNKFNSNKGKMSNKNQAQNSRPKSRGFKKSSTDNNVGQEQGQNQGQNQNQEQVHRQSSSNNNTRTNEKYGFKGKNQTQRQPLAQTQNQTNTQRQFTRTPRLSPEEYAGELEKCSKAFFVHLNEYLGEEFVIKGKPNPDKPKEVPKSTKKTNLQRIQDGMAVNVLKVVYDREKDGDLKYLDNLVRSTDMSLLTKIGTYMKNYGLVTTLKNLNNRDAIFVHSQYVMV